MQARLKKKRIGLLAGLVTMALSAGVYAAPEETFILEQVVVTATATPVEFSKNNTGMVVITGAEIERNHYKSLYEILERVPGFTTPLYANGIGYEISGETAPTMRGSNKVVVLVDGVRQNLGSSYRANALSYNMTDIERVEVLRGSASSFMALKRLAALSISSRSVTGKSPNLYKSQASNTRWAITDILPTLCQAAARTASIATGRLAGIKERAALFPMGLAAKIRQGWMLIM